MLTLILTFVLMPILTFLELAVPRVAQRDAFFRSHA